MDRDPLSPDERAWVLMDDRRWERARRIVQRHPHLDLSGVYHTLIQLERSPAERLRRSLSIGRGLSRARRGA